MSDYNTLIPLFDATIALRRAMGLPDLHDGWATIGLGSLVTALRLACVDVNPRDVRPGALLLARTAADITSCVATNCRCGKPCDDQRRVLTQTMRLCANRMRKDVSCTR